MIPLLLSSALLLSPAGAQEPVPPTHEAIPEIEVVAAEPDRAALESEMRSLREELAGMRTQLEALKEAGPPPRRGAGARVVYGGDVHVRADEVVDEVAAYGGDVVIEGTVLGDATAFSGDVAVVDGARVEGDVASFGGRVEVEDGALVLGDRIAYESGGEAAVAQASGVGGFLSSLYHRLIFLLSFAGAGVLVVGLFPNRVNRIASAIDARPIQAAFVGLFSSGFLVVASVLFAITLVGLPVSFLLMALLGLAWLVGFVGLCQAVGDRLPFQQKHHGRWFAFLVGTVLLSFLGALPLVGWMVVIAASMLGMGAAVATRFGAR